MPESSSSGTALRWLPRSGVPFTASQQFALLVLAGLLFLFSGIYQLFPIPGWVDAGIYLGYALNLPALVERYGLDGVTYHGSRLSYVLVRYFLHRPLNAELAQYVEVGGLFLLSLGSVFVIGWRRCGGRNTVLVAAFLAFNPLFLSSLVFGGTDGITIFYLLATVATLFSEDGLRGRPLAIGLGGVFAALALIAHFFALVPLTGVGVAFLWASGWRRRSLLRYGWGVLGAGAAILACGLIGVAFGFDFFFFGYSVQMAGRSFQGIGSNYQLPLDVWLIGAYRVLIPVFLLVYSSLLLLLHREMRGDRFFVGSFVGLLLVSALYVFWDAVLAGVVVQTRPYFNLLLPVIVLHLLGLAGVLSRHPNSGASPWWILALPAVLFGLNPMPAAQLLDLRTQRMVMVALCVTFLVLVLGQLRRALLRRAEGKLSALWPLVLLLACCATMNFDSIRIFRVATDLDYREAYRGSVRFVEWLERSGLAEARPRIWFDRAELNTQLGDRGVFRLKFKDSELSLNYYDTLCSLYLWSRSLFSDRISVSPADLAKMDPGAVIVFLTQDETKLSQAREVLAGPGRDIMEIGSARYESATFGWHARAFSLRGAYPDLTEHAATKPSEFETAAPLPAVARHDVAMLALLFGLGLWMCGVGRLRRVIAHGLGTFTGWLKRRRVVELVEVRTVQPNLDLIRVLVGAIATVHYGVLLISVPATGPSSLAVFGITMGLMLSVGVTLGICSPAVSLVLMLGSNLMLDRGVGLSGNQFWILSNLLLVFALAPAGCRLSFDARWLGQQGYWADLIRRIYSAVGEPSQDRLILTKISAAVLFWLPCVSWAMRQSTDSAWTSGYALSTALLSPVLNPGWFVRMQWLYEVFPLSFMRVSQLMSVGLLVFVTVSLPALLFGDRIRSWIVFGALVLMVADAVIFPLDLADGYLWCFWLLLFGMPPRLSGLKVNDSAWSIRLDRFLVRLRSLGLSLDGVAVGAGFPAPKIARPPLTRLFCAAIGVLLVFAMAYATTFEFSWDPSNSDRSAHVSEGLFTTAPSVLGLRDRDLFPTIELSLSSVKVTTQVLAFDGPDVQAPVSPRRHAKEVQSIAAQLSRASRMNLRCDEELFETMISAYRTIGEGRFPRVRVQVFYQSLPTLKDFQNLHPRVPRTFPLCWALLNTKAGKISELHYFQEGVDAVLGDLGLDPVISAAGARMVAPFPCDEERAYLLRLLERYGGSLIEKRELDGVTALLLRDRPGAFNESCVVETWHVTELLAARFHTRLFPPIESGSCKLELELAGAFLNQSLPATLADDVERDFALAQRDLAKGDVSGCLQRAQGIRNAVWDHVTMTPGERSTARFGA